MCHLNLCNEFQVMIVADFSVACLTAKMCLGPCFIPKHPVFQDPNMDRNFLHDILPWGLLVEGQCPKVTRLAGIGLKLPANGSQVQGNLRKTIK